MTDHHHEFVPADEPELDADVSGHLTTGLFAGVIVITLILMYALATAG